MSETAGKYAYMDIYFWRCHGYFIAQNDNFSQKIDILRLYVLIALIIVIALIDHLINFYTKLCI